MRLDIWLLFCVSAFVAAASPGPSVVHAVRYATNHGFKRASASICGNTGAILLACITASAGIALISKPAVLTPLKWAGAIYLMYLGIRMYFSKDSIEKENAHSPESYLHILRDAFLLSLSNPKIIIFIAAFFPQFLNSSGNSSLQFTIMSLTFSFFTATTLVFYTATASKLFRNPKFGAMVNRFSGIALVGFALFMLIRT